MSDASDKIFTQKIATQAKLRMTIDYWVEKGTKIDETFLESYIQHHGINDTFTAAKFDAWVEEMKKLNEITKYK